MHAESALLLFYHTEATFIRLSSLLTKRIPEALYANSGLRFGISKNPEGHYIVK